MRTFAMLVFLAACSSVSAGEATIVSFEHKSKVQRDAGVFYRGLDVDEYQELVVEMDGLEITCRTYAMGGGAIYISNNPLVFVAGRKLEAEIWRDRELRVTVPNRNKPLKFDILSARALN